MSRGLRTPLGGLLPGALAALAAVLLTACGLPLESGVRSSGRVAGDSVEPADIQVLPPGPRRDAGARAIVLGFLGAQSNPDDGHAIARQFLHPDVRPAWDDRSNVVVYDPASLEIAPDPLDESAVVVRAEVLARIADDGAYLLDPGRLDEVYRLRPDDEGQLRLTEVPAGLRLTPADAGRSFSPFEVYFLGPVPDTDSTAPLVPDRVFLPVGADPVDALVRRLLAGPSAPLRGAVTSALPPGTALRRPVTTADGVVTVDLTAQVRETDQQARRQLSAQLVWTLQGAGQVFTSLRLLVEGRPLQVDDAPPLQDRSDWAAYDPAGSTSDRVPALYVQDRRVRPLAGPLASSAATDGSLPVDSAVASPADGALALLTRLEGVDEVRAGPVSGPFPVLVARAGVSSMSWGGGGRGLWLVARRGQADGSGPEVLVADPEAPGSVGSVPYAQPSGAGPLTVLRVSRDGARVAAVFGEGADRQLHVGRIERGSEGLQLTGLRSVAPTLTDVADVAWESGTSLVALARLDTTTRLPVRVAVDGSELEPVRTLGLDGEPQTLTATVGRPLVVGAVLGDRPVLFVQEGELFRLQNGTGGDPSYPG